ncbi:hypothetical protein [Oleiharenicola lentus]|uniref:hypothetical protein n=1 Tax=Oleiharenicola lentus TaxID=2508720 RepID=UPI001C55413D|nr:hypothetical protein [Oleiharenicola lentus]
MHTYNPRSEQKLEERVRESERNLCKLVIVTGHTKSGKTVLTQRVLPRNISIWVDGGAVKTEDDFWQIVIEALDVTQTVQISDQTERTLSAGSKGGAQMDLFVFKGGGEINAGIAQKSGKTISRARAVSARVAALQAMRERKTPLVIDDFHYLPKEIQGSVVRALKQLIFEGLPVVIIAIPHRRYDAIKVEREMTGRIHPVQIRSWADDELRFISNTGFPLLGTYLMPIPQQLLAENAMGSPHLMQEFCREICRSKRFREKKDGEDLFLDNNELEDIFREVAESIGRPIFEKLARGPRQRSDRMQRELKQGKKVDIYELVLHALAFLKPGLVSLEYENLRAAIKEVSVQGIPQMQEVVRVLKHMAKIAATDQSSTPVIDFEESEKKLHITDPFFAFYLRWGKIGA